MKNYNKRVGVDVGGTHITSTLVDLCNEEMVTELQHTTMINSGDTADVIVTALYDSLKNILSQHAEVESVGIAFPGPFDYQEGVCAVSNVGGKFEKAFGLHVRQALNDYALLQEVPIVFSNDAHCFAAGAYQLHRLTSKRTVFLTLGSGFGSAFVQEGVLLTKHTDIPESGAFYGQDFGNGRADDFFSSRWLLNAYKKIAGTSIASVKELAENTTAESTAVWNEFGSNMGRFLLPWLEQFKSDELVIGGNIAKAFGRFSESLRRELGKLAEKINIITIDNTEECIAMGAAINATTGNTYQPLRKTLQDLLPVSFDRSTKPGYDIYPAFKSGKRVYSGFDSLAGKIADTKMVVIDGYDGVLWEPFRAQLHGALTAKNKKVYWYDVSVCLKDSAVIDEMIAGSLNGDDPVFGKRHKRNLVDFFDANKLKLISPDPSADLCIVYGTGAALTGIPATLLYIDVPKNEIQFRMRAGSITNLGANEIGAGTQMYKRFYFVDWPVLNQHKAALLPLIDCIIDEQRIDEITWMEGNGFRAVLDQLLQQPFRARPWFEPGVWGGDWMKKRIQGLHQDAVNYAWSFELITPENGIVMEGEGNLMEVSFDYLLYADNAKLLGKAAKRFGTEFPIRFDFLDTFNGGNLSIQCHPRPDYIRERFGENFTQDETYYILDCEPDAHVYLGFQENIDPVAFKKELENAQQQGNEVDIVKYVQQLPAKKHDLFLIPNGTIHASGKNNLVLEISSTPYIFTFKMYDWQRLDLNGKPRPINIEHAFNNLYFDRKGEYVGKRLVSHPVIEKEWPGGRKLKLPTHAEHFYSVDRYEFEGAIEISTQGQCHVCMLVEGDAIEVTVGAYTNTFHFAETFVVPASVGQYQVVQRGNKKAFLVVAYVKDECC